MNEARRKWLTEVSKWKLEAADEDNSRYFFNFPQVTEVQTGEANYVIGRKVRAKPQ